MPPQHLHLLDVVWKTLFFYVFLLLLLRVTGKREVGALNAIDLVGFIMISEAAIITIADHQIPFLVGLVPVVLLGAMEWLFAYLSLKDGRVRTLVEGRPSILIERGRLNAKKMRQLRYNLGDLMAEMRAKNVANIADVEFAILETTGKLSVLPRAGARPLTPDDLRMLGVTDKDPAATLPPVRLPATVISDGEVDEQALQRAGRDRAWLVEAIAAQGCPRIEDVLLASIDPAGNLQVQRHEADAFGVDRGGSSDAN